MARDARFIYIYIFKRYAHAIYVKLQHRPCLASRLRPMKKLAPMFFETLPVIKSRSKNSVYIYIYIEWWFREKTPFKVNDNFSSTESFFGHRVFQHGRCLVHNNYTNECTNVVRRPTTFFFLFFF